MSRDRFERRRKKHDKEENKVMDFIRPFTDRKHLPDRRVSFSGTPCSFDYKSTVHVEDNSHDEYFRLWREGEPVFIVFKNGNDDLFYADWIINLSWSGPHEASENSTSGDDYYRINGTRTLHEFLKDAPGEVAGWKALGKD